MNRIDDELERALEGSVAQPTPDLSSEEHPIPPVATSRGARRDRRRPRSWGLLLGLVVMGGAILAIVVTGIDGAAVYSKGVTELLQQKARFASRNVRVVGTLVRGSLLRRDEPCEYRFRLYEGTAELEIHYPQCVIPDTFRDVPNVDVQVTAEGRLQSDGIFQAHQIMAKCPSKYDMNKRVGSGEAAPHLRSSPQGQPQGSSSAAVGAEAKPVGISEK